MFSDDVKSKTICDDMTLNNFYLRWSIPRLNFTKFMEFFSYFLKKKKIKIVGIPMFRRVLTDEILMNVEIELYFLCLLT